MVYIRDVAQVRDGYAVQQNIVSQNRVRSALLTVLKSANASTLDIINRVKEALPSIQATLPTVAGADAAFRPVDLRARLDQRRAARGADRGVPDGADDPALPGELAEHAGGGDLHPALDPVLDHHHGRARADAEYHDAGRAGAGGGHPGGRRHGGDREHPPQPGDGEADGAGDPGRRAADRGAGVRLDALHLHRVRAGLLPERRGEVPLPAAGDGGDLRDAGLVFPLAHGGADDGEIPAAGACGGVPARGRGGGRAARGFVFHLRIHERFEHGFEKAARCATPAC